MRFLTRQTIENRLQKLFKQLVNNLRLTEFTLSLIGILCLVSVSPVLAGGGHAHGPSGQPVVRSNAVEITDTTARNIGLQVETVERRQIFETIVSWGRIAVKPSDRRIVSSRIRGQLHELNVEKGQSVKTGDPVAVVESLQMGNPPPRATYRAPTGGIVSEIYVSPGEGVGANQRIVSITSPKNYRIRTRVHERHLDRVSYKTRAMILPDPGADTSWSASINHIGVHVDPISGYGTVWFKPDRTNGIRPFFGKRVSVDLLVGSPDSHPAVPRSALLGTSGDHFVFVQAPESPGKFLKRTVVLGTRNGRYVAIKDGLRTGDTVVVEGNYQLQYASPAESDDPSGHPDHGNGGHGHAQGSQPEKTHEGHSHGEESQPSDHGHAHGNDGGHHDRKQKESSQHGHPHGEHSSHEAHDRNQSDGHGHDHEGGTDH